MGVDSRRPILPAPTDSIVGTSAAATDLETDVSQRTDNTSYDIPENGDSITIPTVSGQKHNRGDKDDPQSPISQTSLLIEYFENGRDSGSLTSRPSIRVRVTPSGSRKSRNSHRDNQHKNTVRVSDSGGVQRPAFARHISLASPTTEQRQLPGSSGDDQSAGSPAHDSHIPSRHLPVEIELMGRDGNSEIIDSKYAVQSSDISSIPPDSMLDEPSSGPRRKRSRSPARDEKPHESDNLLKTPSRRRSRSLSKERFAQRVAEKISTERRDDSTSKATQHKPSGRSKGVSKGALAEDDPKYSKRRSHGRQEVELASPESSLLSASIVSSQNLPADQHSYRTSKSSLNNPKLLETVEDAIRRLILPELKELKKDQKVMTNTSKFDRGLNATQPPQDAPSKAELARRLSKHSSAPDVIGPGVVRGKDSKDHGTVLTGETLAGESPSGKGDHRANQKVESPSGKSSISRDSRPDLTESNKPRRRKSKGLRDAEAAGKVGTALTAAALSRHESQSSLTQSGKRNIASQSRTNVDEIEPNINETELLFKKHNVPPMPLHSDVNSGLTRDSLLSQRTDETPAPDSRNIRRGDVSRGFPAQGASPSFGPRTPDRNRLGLHHSNMSSNNLSDHSASDRDLRDHARSSANDSTLTSDEIAAAASANLLDGHPGFPYVAGPKNTDSASRRQTLSPIQSVASLGSGETQVKHPQAARNGYTGLGGNKEDMEPHLSIASLTSAPSTELARSTRLGLSADSRSDTKFRNEVGSELGYEASPGHSRGGSWGQRSQAEEVIGIQHPGERRSSRGGKGNMKREDTGYTNDSEVDYLVNKGQQVGDVSGANPKFVQPSNVESAVASLLDPSVLTTKSSKLATDSGPGFNGQQQKQDTGNSQPAEEKYTPRESPPGQRQNAAISGKSPSPEKMRGASPPQSETQSVDGQDQSAHQVPANTNVVGESPSPRTDRSPESESEINTNPSIIHGPGGTSQAEQEPWSHMASPREGKKRPPYPDDDETGYGFGGYPATPAPGAIYDANGFFNQPEDEYMGGQPFETPPGQKDEGYASAANQVSPNIDSPKAGNRNLDGGDDLDGNLGLFDNPGENEPFDVSGHERNLSGYSHGMGSPMYDSATGKGVERIKSKDIIALMDHLTVRDAQRNARDTELLVTLVRSAAEMRTSFEEMKKFIAQQDELIMETSDKQHERTQRVIGGPRPLPPSSSRATRQASFDDAENVQKKRQNVFKRALKGLNFKSSNDLARIEDMLEQLLDDVEDLRAVQEDGRGPGTHAAGADNDFPRYGEAPRDPVRRFSTVPEEDEDTDFDGNNGRPVMHARTESAPAHTQSRVQIIEPEPDSDEATPKSAEKGRKHKSSSSSFFPKISRWSKNTASSMGENIRNSMQTGRKERPYSDMSYSRSDFSQGQYKTGEFYDPHGDDRIRSNQTLDGQQRQQENRPPSPLVPSQVSETPKYRAHRGSIDLQHPQPRQGPSGHYQTRLESQAYEFGGPLWGASNPSLLGPGDTNPNPSHHHENNDNNNQYGNDSRLSPISDANFSEMSSLASKTPPPPRPPKVRETGPLIPERVSSKARGDEGGDGPNNSYMDRVVSRSSAMRSTPPLRKPTGPRPLTSGGSQHSPGRSKRTARYRGSPEQTVDDVD